MGACSPITLPVTVGLGGSMAVAFNALTSVLATSSGGRFCTRGSSIRLMLFPYSMVVGHRALVDSLDPVSVFEATINIAPR